MAYPPNTLQVGDFIILRETYGDRVRVVRAVRPRSFLYSELHAPEYYRPDTCRLDEYWAKFIPMKLLSVNDLTALKDAQVAEDLTREAYGKAQRDHSDLFYALAKKVGWARPNSRD